MNHTQNKWIISKTISLIFRGTALAFTVTSGRFGAVIGNIVIGSLVDTYCIIPMALFAFSLFCKTKFQPLKIFMNFH